jgi:hypothetical protein
MKVLQYEPMTRNPSERIVADHLMDQGFRVFSRGWPDFLAIRDDGVALFVEVKRDDQNDNATTAEQDLILEMLGAVYRREVSPTFTVVRPRDLGVLDLQIHLCAEDAKSLKSNASPSSEKLQG